MEKHFSRSTIFLHQRIQPCQAAKKEDGTPDEECITVLYRAIVYKEAVIFANIALDSYNHVVDLHTDTDPPQSKEELWEKNKSVFDSSQAQYDFRNQDRQSSSNYF